MTTPLVEKVAKAIRWASMDESTAAAWRDDTFKATKGELEVAQAAISAVYDWQDISTAPRDGTEIIVFAPHIGAPVMARWIAEEEDWLCADYEGGFWLDEDEPIHWLPVPTPPQTGKG